MSDQAQAVYGSIVSKKNLFCSSSASSLVRLDTPESLNSNLGVPPPSDGLKQNPSVSSDSEYSNSDHSDSELDPEVLSIKKITNTLIGEVKNKLNRYKQVCNSYKLQNKFLKTQIEFFKDEIQSGKFTNSVKIEPLHIVDQLKQFRRVATCKSSKINEEVLECGPSDECITEYLNNIQIELEKLRENYEISQPYSNEISVKYGNKQGGNDNLEEINDKYLPKLESDRNNTTCNCSIA
jgi:hypothetical protein